MPAPPQDRLHKSGLTIVYLVEGDLLEATSLPYEALQGALWGGSGFHGTSDNVNSFQDIYENNSFSGDVLIEKIHNLENGYFGGRFSNILHNNTTGIQKSFARLLARFAQLHTIGICVHRPLLGGEFGAPTRAPAP